jgi:prepilin signal peptidase PulO-like enzyme (type II secretory pathway)
MDEGGGVPTGLPLGARFLGVAAAVGAVVVGIVAVGGPRALLLRRGLLGIVLVGCAESDRRWGLVPNELIVAGLLGALALLLVEGRWGPILSGGSAAAVLLGCRIGGQLWRGRPGFGGGDVKLVGLLGLCLGWEVFWALYLAVAMAGVVGVGGLLFGRMKQSSRLPFAPFLALGTAVHWFFLPFSLASGLLYL